MPDAKFTDDLFEFLQVEGSLSAAKTPIPSKVQELIACVQPFVKQVLVLQRAGMFYNNMADRIIECQGPMLLQPATEFEKLVKSIKNLNSSSAPKMMSQLQSSLSNIMAQNSQLPQENTNINTKINELFDTSLIDKRHCWTQQVIEMRDIDEKALKYQLRVSLLAISERTSQSVSNIL